MYLLVPPPPPPRAFRLWLRTLLLSALLWALPVTALDTTAEIEIVRSSNAAPYATAAAAVVQTLNSNGKTIATVDLDELTASDAAGYRALAATGAAKLYVAIGSQAAEWLHTHLPADMMLIYCMVADPESRALNQGNPAFGISTTIAWAEQCRLIQRALPQAKRIGMLYARKDPASKAAMETVKAHLAEGLELAAVAIEDSETISDAIESLMDTRPDVIWTSPDSAVYSSAAVRAMLLLALRHKVPVYGFSTPFVRAGALFGVGIEPDHQGKQCGKLCAAYLAAVKDGKTAEFLKQARVIAPQFQVAVNQIVARQLDRALPDEFVEKAEVVYKPE